MINTALTLNYKNNKLLYYLVYIYLILKPFYIFESGTLQISDIFILLAFALLFFIMKKEKEMKLQINKQIFLLTIFICFVIFINTIYSILYFRTDFLVSSLFYIFDFIGVYVLYYCIKDLKVLSNIRIICIFNILLQLFIYIIHLGRWYAEDVRYMGTFNDPNQFAFFIFASLIIIYITGTILNKNKAFIIYLISIFLIYESASTGMLLGTGLFIFFIILSNLRKINLRKFLSYGFLFILFIVPIFIILSLSINNFPQRMKSTISDNFVTTRIQDKLTRANDKLNGNIIQERGYDKILNYPYKIIMGAGQGYSDRYITYHNGELHATFPSILFYYGIVPLAILLAWVWENIKFAPFNVKLAFLALFIESFTLQNERQIVFWLIIILCSYYTCKQSNRKLKIES